MSFLARLPGTSSPMPHDRARLESGFVEGSPDAIRVAYERHGPLIHSFCRRAVVAEVAKDLTQEVFITAWRQREKFDPARGVLPAWLIGIARNNVLEALRRRSRRRGRGGCRDRHWVGRRRPCRRRVCTAVQRRPRGCAEWSARRRRGDRVRPTIRSSTCPPNRSMAIPPTPATRCCVACSVRCPDGPGGRSGRWRWPPVPCGSGG